VCVFVCACLCVWVWVWVWVSEHTCTHTLGPHCRRRCWRARRPGRAVLASPPDAHPHLLIPQTHVPITANVVPSTMRTRCWGGVHMQNLCRSIQSKPNAKNDVRRRAGQHALPLLRLLTSRVKPNPKTQHRPTGCA